MLEDVLPRLKIGLVTDQIDLYKKSIYALEDPDKHLKQIQDSVNSLEEKTTDEDFVTSRTMDEEWGHLISESEKPIKAS